MFVSKMSIIVLFLCALQTKAHITIDIESDQLQKLGEILVETYLDHHLLHRPRTTTSVFVSNLRKIGVSMIQMIGIMFTVVGANLLSIKFEPFTKEVNFNENLVNKTILLPCEICKNDFGCDRNICCGKKKC